MRQCKRLLKPLFGWRFVTFTLIIDQMIDFQNKIWIVDSFYPIISHSPCLCSCLPWLCHAHCGELVKFALWTLLLPALAAVLYPHWIGCVRLICDGEVGGFSALILSRSPERTLQNKTALIHNGARQNGRSGPFRLQAIISYVRSFIVEKNHAGVPRERHQSSRGWAGWGREGKWP